MEFTDLDKSILMTLIRSEIQLEKKRKHLANHHKIKILENLKNKVSELT